MADKLEQETKILIVDDEPEIRFLMGMMMKRLGYQATIVESGQEALDELANNDHLYNLVITDLMMSGMTGFELINKVRAVENTRDEELPILVMSADANLSAQLELSSTLDFIAKPFQRIELKSKIEKLIKDEGELKSSR